MTTPQQPPTPAAAKSRRLLVRRALLTIDLATIPDPHHRDDQLGVPNLVENPVVALTQPIFVVTTELFRTHRPRIVRQFSDSGHDPPTVRYRYAFKFLRSRSGEQNAIACHASSDRGRRSRTTPVVL